MDKFPLTTRGAEKLRDELYKLKHVDRPKIIEDIATARAHGDLKENAEYHAARDQQSFAEGRIKEIEGKISNSMIIDVVKVGANAQGRVVFGATVHVADCETGDEVTYQIVGEDEANIKENRISVGSPLSRALIGKSADDVAVVQAPGGVRELEIISVKYIA